MACSAGAASGDHAELGCFFDPASQVRQLSIDLARSRHDPIMRRLGDAGLIAGALLRPSCVLDGRRGGIALAAICEREQPRIDRAGHRGGDRLLRRRHSAIRFRDGVPRRAGRGPQTRVFGL
jgi:hypothetical protein